MRIVGIDVGTRWVVIALSDELESTARPLDTIARGNDAELVAALRRALGEAVPTHFVVEDRRDRGTRDVFRFTDTTG